MFIVNYKKRPPVPDEVKRTLDSFINYKVAEYQKLGLLTVDLNIKLHVSPSGIDEIPIIRHRCAKLEGTKFDSEAFKNSEYFVAITEEDDWHIEVEYEWYSQNFSTLGTLIPWINGK